MSRKQPQQLAVIQIGYACYLVPAKNAAKVIELLSQAVECEDSFGVRDRVYTITRPIVLEYRLVRASQVRRAAGDVDGDEPVTVHGRLTNRAGVQGLLPMPRSKLL